VTFAFLPGSFGCVKRGSFNGCFPKHGGLGDRIAHRRPRSYDRSSSSRQCGRRRLAPSCEPRYGGGNVEFDRPRRQLCTRSSTNREKPFIALPPGARLAPGGRTKIEAIMESLARSILRTRSRCFARIARSSGVMGNSRPSLFLVSPRSRRDHPMREVDVTPPAREQLAPYPPSSDVRNRDHWFQVLG
jgi:hypothetical protein